MSSIDSLLFCVIAVLFFALLIALTTQWPSARRSGTEGFTMDRYHSFAEYRAPSSVLVIEDRLHQEIVMVNNCYDDSVANVFVPSSTGKFSIATDAPASGGTSLFCTSISKYEPRGNYVVACTNDTCFAFFVASSYFDDERDLMFLADKRIGYVHGSDVPVLQRILRCYGLSRKNVALVLVDPNVLGQDELDARSACDCVFILVNPKDPSMAVWANKKVSLYSYRNMDTASAQRLMPCGRVTQVDVTRIFPKMVSDRRVEPVLEFRNVVYSASKSFNYLLDLLVEYYKNNHGYVNFFERYYHVHPRTQEIYGAIDAELSVDKSEKPIMEQFRDGTWDDIEGDRDPASSFGDGQGGSSDGDPRLAIRPTGNVNGYLVPAENAFFYESDVLEGTPLIVGDVVELTHQDRPEENGAYEVVALKNDAARLDRKNPRYPVRVDTDDETHFCVTNPALLYKHECLSPVDACGSRKKTIDVWDGPCTSGLECPFFHYDETAKQYRGGCVDGYCEMPAGYTRIGFKKFINQQVI